MLFPSGSRNDRGVIAGVVPGALARAAVSSISGSDGAVVEAPHGVVVSRKRDVEVLRRGPVDKRERGPAVSASERRAMVLFAASQPEPRGRADELVEAARRGQIRRPKPEVVDYPIAVAGRLVVDCLHTVAAGVP